MASSTEFLCNKAFGGHSGKLTKAEEQELWWFINFIAGTVSQDWKAKAGDKTKVVRYGDLVTESDEAFGILILKSHRDKWISEKDKKQGVVSEEAIKKKKKNASRGFRSQGRRASPLSSRHRPWPSSLD